ncbi:unnamed protein product [Didymodactylos carnosus]|uniref:Uncharacterized protein n=1 Tax=Didymodactylos carnosus TaxID=1234261 RepID=A0A814A4P7_9BILA|nr:unnamed protein product [Didymodactylos carnosus]CAF3689088.1 unnamed protein product [Didymodactylos carnosus]
MIVTFLHQLRSIHFLSLYFLTTLLLFYFIKTSTGINPYHYQQQQHNSLFDNNNDNDEVMNRQNTNNQQYLHLQEPNFVDDDNINDLTEQQDDEDYHKRNKFPNFHVSPLWLSRRTRNRFYGKPLWISRTG